jgi:hypothetical protein
VRGRVAKIENLAHPPRINVESNQCYTECNQDLLGQSPTKWSRHYSENSKFSMTKGAAVRFYCLEAATGRVSARESLLNILMYTTISIVSSRVVERTRLILVKDGFGGDLAALDWWTGKRREDAGI